MNRRAFVSGGATAAAFAATGGLGLSRGFAQSSLDDSFVQYQIGVLATALDHLHSNQGSDVDCYLASGVCTQMASYLRSSGADASLQAMFAGVSPAMLSPNPTIDPNSLYNALNAMAPSVGLQDYVSLASSMAVPSSEVPAILDGLRQYGLAHYLDSMAEDFRLMGDGFYLAPAAMGGGGTTMYTYNPPPTEDPPQSPPGGKRPFLPPPPSPPGGTLPTEEEKHQYACHQDTLRAYKSGLVTLGLAGSCYIGVVTGVLCTGGFALFLGVAGTVWTTAHIYKCGL